MKDDTTIDASPFAEELEIATAKPKSKAKAKAKGGGNGGGARPPSGHPPGAGGPPWRRLLMTTKTGRPFANVANAIVLIRNTAWSGVFAFDDFAQSIRVVAPPPWDACDAPATIEEAGAEITDTDVTRLAAWLARHEGLDVTTDLLWKAIAVAAEARRVHPVRAYLEGLRWDRKPRVERWMSTHLGAADEPYVRRVGPLMLRSAVARAMRPGAKVDTMTVLEGPQGGRKSTSIKLLFGPQWTSDSPIDFGTKDRFVQLRGKWGVEIPELDGFDRADVNRIKSFLSSPVDDFRPPYGRASVRAPRQCVFVGTVNPGAGGYLRDVTGNRRFWPVRVGEIDLEAIARDRDQLWAEALTEFRAGRPWWPEAPDTEMFVEEQGKRAATDAWDDAIAKWVEDREFVTVAEVLERALGIFDKEKHTQPAQNRAAAALVRLGRERVRRRFDGRPVWGYSAASVPTDPTSPKGVGSP